MGNDLPYILFLPSYTAAAWAHQKLEPKLMQNFSKALEEAQHFATHDYALALLQGDLLDHQKRAQTIQQLARFTGLSTQFIDTANMRVCNSRFEKELLRDQKRTIGRFDSRYLGIDSDFCGSRIQYDPSFDIICGVFSAAFNAYMQTDLKWNRDEEYHMLANVWPWDYGKAKNSYLDVGEALCQVMTKNPSLRVFVASGFFDLAIPYSATNYTFSHLGIDPSLKENILLHTYKGGHMMYLDPAILPKMKEDLTEFYQKSLRVQKRT